MTIKSYSQFMDDYETALEAYAQEIQSNPNAAASMTQDELMGKISDIMIETIKDVPVVETAPIDVECTKTNNVWEMSSSAEQAIQTAMMSS